jgi:hypothetical protein
MKKINLLVLLLAAVFCFSCNKDDDKETPANYSVLGVASATINGQLYKVNSGMKLDASNDKNVNINGVENRITKKHILFDYSVIVAAGVTPSVSFTSIYPDASIVVAEKPGTTAPTFTVTITRKGYEEQLTYTFKFMVLK